MVFDTHSPVPDVSVGGPLPGPVADKLHRVVVDGQRNLPAMCEIEFSDDDFTVIDNPMFRPGMSLTVSVAPASEDPTQTSLGPLFDGEVVAVEAAFTSDGGSRLLLRGYDKAHRLHRTRRTRTFLMQPDSLIATTIASDHGLTPRVDPTGGPNDYLCQRNQTDWEFLCERAREIGFEISVSKGALVFRRAGADPLAGVPQQLDRSDNLLSFRPRVTSAEQPMTTKVRSWNPVLKSEVPGVAPPAVPENTPQDPSLLPTTVATQFGSTEDAGTDLPFDLPTGAMANAAARRQHSASASFEAEGTCIGNPAMVPGGRVNIAGVGTRFSGSYTLSSVRHVFDEDAYRTHFTINGPHDRSLLGLTQPGAATRATSTQGGGADTGSAVVAKVTNTTDPMQMGRVKVEFPWLGDRAESHWAQVVSVGAGSGKGWQIIPEVGDQVLVVFAHGDMRRPYVLGGLYNSQDLPPEPVGSVAGGKTNIRTFKTRAGHSLTFDDTPGAEGITLETHMGSIIAVTEAPSPSIEIADKSGNNKITIDGAGQSISIEAAANLELVANGTLSLEGKGGVSIEGAKMDIKTLGNLNIEGSVSSIKSSGPLTVQGTPIKLN